MRVTEPVYDNHDYDVEQYGKGLYLHLDGNEVARSIDEWIKRQGLEVKGARTIRLEDPDPHMATGGARIFVDPSGSLADPDGVCDYDPPRVRERTLERVQQDAPAGGGAASLAGDPAPGAGPPADPGLRSVRIRVKPLSEKGKHVLRQVLGERCAEARKRIGHSQRGLAKELDMSPSWVREYEAGSQFPPSWLIVTLAESAALPVQWFYGYGAMDRMPEGWA